MAEAIELQDTARSCSDSVENSDVSLCETLSKRKSHLICMAILVVAAVVALIAAIQLIKSWPDLVKDEGTDQGWSVWSSWGTCSKTCSEGLYTSTRTCTSTDTSISENSCIGPNNKTQSCTLRSCPEWTTWSSWTPCSSSCGGGQQKSTRTCGNSTDTTLSGSSCIGPDTKSQVCALRLCPEWSSWSSWSSCSSSCGVGQQKSTRTCSITATSLSGKGCVGSDKKTQVCILPSCTGWSGWSSWSTCSKTCGVGLQTTTRTCSSTDTPLSESSCIGLYNKTQACTFGSCLEWTTWSSWTPCSSSCGGGQQKSTRTCSNSTDTTLSGSSCIGPDTKSQVCALRLCPEWSVWSSWSSCSSSCGVSQQKSTRTCSITETSLSGKGCVGSDKKTQICTLPSCPDPKDCLDVLNLNKTNVNGVYNVTSPSSGRIYPVYCDMTTDGGGWTVFQKRFNGELGFYRKFESYERGFGDVNAEFWMGLKRIHDMTAHHKTELRIDLTAADGSTAYETYQDFFLSSGPDYTLNIGQAAGTAGAIGLSYNKGRRFSTKDKDVDGASGKDCAEYHHGGWWYNQCTNVNLNGDYGTPGRQSSYNDGNGGVLYYSFNFFKSLKTTSMMFRRK